AQAALSLAIAAVARGLGGLALETVLGNLAVQGGAADLEDRRRGLLVPADPVEDPRDVGLLGRREARERRRLAARLREPADGRELDVGSRDDATRCRQRRAGDRVLELADVARPVVLDQAIDGVG